MSCLVLHTRRPLLTLMGAFVFLLCIEIGLACCQDAVNRPTAVPTQPVPTRDLAPSPENYGQTMSVEGFLEQRNSILSNRYFGGNPSPLAQAMKQLGETKDEATKEKLVVQIQRLLGEEYDRHLTEHENSLDKMEERLEKLREQLAKRRSAKSKVVELRMQQLLNEAEGLGWPGSEREKTFLDWPAANLDPHGAWAPAVPPLLATPPTTPEPPPAVAPERAR